MASLIKRLNLLEILPYVLFILSMFFLPVFSNFAVNDDWIFVRQVESFHKGNPIISALIDPTFIFQGIVGSIWGSIFGVSFISLRILTLLMVIIMTLSVQKTLKLFEVNKYLIFITLLILLFNPIVYNSAFSFMTEIYYLCFFSWGIYFYLKDLKGDFDKKLIWEYKYVFLGTLFSVFAFLVRQYGVLLPLVYSVFLFLLYWSNRKRDTVLINFVKKIFIVWSLVILGVLVYIIWSRYIDPKSSGNFISNLADFPIILLHLKKLLFTLPYFTYFLLPILFILEFLNKRGLKYYVLVFLFSIPLAFTLFNYDIFPLGSVFYLEGLHIKSDFRHVSILGDTVLFKIFVSLVISYFISNYFVQSILWLKSFDVKRFKLDTPILFLIVLIFVSLFSLVIANDFYDRYLLPAFLSLLLLVSIKTNSIFKEIRFSHPYLLGFILFIFCLFNFSLNLDFYTKTSLSWDIANRLQSDKSINTQVYVDDVFGKYYSVVKKGDYTGLQKADFFVNDAFCFVQDYVLEDKDNLYMRLDSFVQEYVVNPRVFDSKKKNISRIGNNMDKVLYNKEYKSLLYNIVGSKVFVGGYCVE